MTKVTIDLDEAVAAAKEAQAVFAALAVSEAAQHESMQSAISAITGVSEDDVDFVLTTFALAFVKWMKSEM